MLRCVALPEDMELEMLLDALLIVVCVGMTFLFGYKAGLAKSCSGTCGTTTDLTYLLRIGGARALSSELARGLDIDCGVEMDHDFLVDEKEEDEGGGGSMAECSVPTNLQMKR